MGCVSSHFLHGEDDFPHLRSSALGHHIVSLTSSTYGLLNLDPPSACPSSANASPTITPPTVPLFNCNRLRDAEVINSWDLMSGLDAESFRIVPKDQTFDVDKENLNPNSTHVRESFTAQLDGEIDAARIFKPKLHPISGYQKSNAAIGKLEELRDLCPPLGENKVVIYTTTLRGIRKTFEDCNMVRSAMEGFEVEICERDVSMDRGFKEEIRQLMSRDGEVEKMLLPRMFVKGKYVGGVEEVAKIMEEGWMGEILQGIPRKKQSKPCEGCGGVRFVPCLICNGSCKKKLNLHDSVVRCPHCNENGLILCPVCI